MSCVSKSEAVSERYCVNDISGSMREAENRNNYYIEKYIIGW